MRLSKFGSVAVWLVCAAPAFAEAPRASEKEMWITIGTDALGPVRGALQGQGQTLAAPLAQKGGVAVLRVRESQVDQIARTMHDTLNRCAGFVAHDSQQEAVAAMEAASAPRPAASLAPSYSINNGPSTNDLIGQVTETQIRGTINSLSSNWTNRYYDVQNGADASTWLKNTWTTIANGRSDITVELFAHTWKQSSVIATITGTTLPNEVVVIGGHLDSINLSNRTTGTAPGADDDASGVAAVTEVLRVAVLKGYKPARTVKIIAYAGEEVGLYGSKAIANSFKSSGVNVVGALQLDMTEYKGSSYDFGFVTDYTDSTLTTFTQRLITTYLPGLTYTSFACGYACSDHASWYNAGYPSVMPFEATIDTDNPQIHGSGDTLAYLKGVATNSVKFAKLGASFVAEVAKGATTGNTPPSTGGGSTGGTANTATYNATYKAPACTAAGASCDSGTLLGGRGSVGPESNAPNTLSASCADGASGTYHSDESNDRLKVSTTDGTNLAAGKTVTVSATVWSYSATSDKLDLYYAASAASPTWTLIGTYSPSTSGASTITASYTLPSGGTQAIRANFRYSSSSSSAASVCSSGSYDDRDDLVFTVQ